MMNLTLGDTQLLIDAAKKAGLLRNQTAYLLATVYHETAHTMRPIEEYGHGRGHAYGVPTGPWHKVYDGNGDVQLTWERNYIFATKRLHALGLFPDVDLDKNPELARRDDVAAAIAVIGMKEGWFTGKKLADYIDLKHSDFVNARRIINAMDRAVLIAGYATAYDGLLKPLFA